MFLQSFSEDAIQRRESQAETIQFQGDLWKNFTDACSVTPTQQSFMIERLASRREEIELTDAGGCRATSTGVVGRRVENWDAIKVAREEYQNPWEAEQDACVRQSDNEREIEGRADAELKQEELQNLGRKLAPVLSFTAAATHTMFGNPGIRKAFGIQAGGHPAVPGVMASARVLPANRCSLVMN